MEMTGGEYATVISNSLRQQQQQQRQQAKRLTAMPSAGQRPFVVWEESQTGCCKNSRTVVRVSQKVPV